MENRVWSWNLFIWLFSMVVSSEGVIRFACSANQVLIVHAKGNDFIKMHCAKPKTCGAEPKCEYSMAFPYCRDPTTFLSSVFQQNDQANVMHNCCRFAATAPRDIFEEQGCFAHRLKDDKQTNKTKSNNPNNALRRLKRQVESTRIQDPYNLRLFKLRSKSQPILLVKGILKLSDGYTVVICKYRHFCADGGQGGDRPENLLLNTTVTPQLRASTTTTRRTTPTSTATTTWTRATTMLRLRATTTKRRGISIINPPEPSTPTSGTKRPGIRVIVSRPALPSTTRLATTKLWTTPTVKSTPTTTKLTTRPTTPKPTTTTTTRPPTTTTTRPTPTTTTTTRPTPSTTTAKLTPPPTTTRQTIRYTRGTTTPIPITWNPGPRLSEPEIKQPKPPTLPPPATEEKETDVPHSPKAGNPADEFAPSIGENEIPIQANPDNNGGPPQPDNKGSGSTSREDPSDTLKDTEQIPNPSAPSPSASNPSASNPSAKGSGSTSRENTSDKAAEQKPNPSAPSPSASNPSASNPSASIPSASIPSSPSPSAQRPTANDPGPGPGGPKLANLIGQPNPGGSAAKVGIPPTASDPVGSEPTQDVLAQAVSAFGCFSEDMEVWTPNGKRRMDNLTIGDEVLVASNENGFGFMPIEWFYHRDPSVEAEFLTLETISGRQLTLTPNHLIPFIPDCATQSPSADPETLPMDFVFASRASATDCIAVYDRDGLFQMDRVARVFKQTRRGVYSPMTEDGTILVNDVHVSCYSVFENHGLQHCLYDFLKMIWRAFEFLRHAVLCIIPYYSDYYSSDVTDHFQDVPVTLNIFKQVAQLIMPANFGL